MICGTLNLEKISHDMMTILHICPLHLSNVDILPWEVQKVIFNSIIHTYFWLFMLSQKKTTISKQLQLQYNSCYLFTSEVT